MANRHGLTQCPERCYRTSNRTLSKNSVHPRYAPHSFSWTLPSYISCIQEVVCMHSKAIGLSIICCHYQHMKFARSRDLSKYLLRTFSKAHTHCKHHILLATPINRTHCWPAHVHNPPSLMPRPHPKKGERGLVNMDCFLGLAGSVGVRQYCSSEINLGSDWSLAQLHAGWRFKFIQQAMALWIPAVGESYDYAKAAFSLERSNSQVHTATTQTQTQILGGWCLGTRLYYSTPDHDFIR